MQIKELKLSQIVVTGLNPRKNFNEEKHKELVESIKKSGLLNALIVRPFKTGINQFELICGERRLRALQELKTPYVQADVRESVSDQEAMEIQLVENIQRADLSPVEEGRAFKALMAACKCIQEAVAQKIGKSQAYIAARLSLLDLRADFLKLLEEGKLQPGHIKSILIIKGCDSLLDKVFKQLKEYFKTAESITVKEFDAMVDRILSRNAKPLFKLGYGEHPEFDLKACEKCPSSKVVDLTYDKGKKLCLKPECWAEKQSTVHRAEAERGREKVKSGKVVKEEDLPKDTKTFDLCGFNKKTCAKCDKRKVGMVKDYSGKSVSKEICLDKECFERKEKEARDVKEKAEVEEFKKKVEKYKAKAAAGKTDRSFIVMILADTMNQTYGDAREGAIVAYGLKKEIFETKKKALEYFTRNTKVNVDEILRFITYWDN